jgi:hypothetical protein
VFVLKDVLILLKSKVSELNSLKEQLGELGLKGAEFDDEEKKVRGVLDEKVLNQIAEAPFVLLTRLGSTLIEREGNAFRYTRISAEICLDVLDDRFTPADRTFRELIDAYHATVQEGKALVVDINALKRRIIAIKAEIKQSAESLGAGIHLIDESSALLISPEFKCSFIPVI